MSQQPDYDALAKQYGAQTPTAPAQVDYDAIAKQYGAGGNQPQSWMDKVSDFASEWWKQVNPVAGVKGLAQAASSPIQTGKAMLEAQGDLKQKAEDAFKRGDYAEGVRHTLNYLLPVLGPQSDVAGTMLQNPQTRAAGLGMTAGIGTNLAAPELLKNGIGLPGVRSLSEKMYQSALKPGPGSYSTAEVRNMVNTGISNRIPVSAEGIGKLNNLVEDLGNKVKAQIQGGAQAGATIDRSAVAQRLGDTYRTFSNQVSPSADIDAINRVRNDFMANQPAQIPVDQAQALKQGTYQQLKDRSYGELSTATKESQKALARGIKEELESQFPDIIPANAQQARLYGLKDALEHAVRRIDNRNIFGLGGTIAASGSGIATGVATGSLAEGALATATTAILHKVLTDPEVMSKMSFALSKAGRVGMNVGRARYLGYVNALGQATGSSAGQSNGQ